MCHVVSAGQQTPHLIKNIIHVESKDQGVFSCPALGRRLGWLLQWFSAQRWCSLKKHMFGRFRWWIWEVQMDVRREPLATFCCWDITLCFGWSDMEFWKYFFWRDCLKGLKVKRYIHSGWHHGDLRIEYAQMKEVASKNDPGDYYGIKFPYTKVPGINARKWILWGLCGFGLVFGGVCGRWMYWEFTHHFRTPVSSRRAYPIPPSCFLLVGNFWKGATFCMVFVLRYPIGSHAGEDRWYSSSKTGAWGFEDGVTSRHVKSVSNIKQLHSRLLNVLF